METGGNNDSDCFKYLSLFIIRTVFYSARQKAVTPIFTTTVTSLKDCLTAFV